MKTSSDKTSRTPRQRDAGHVNAIVGLNLDDARTRAGRTQRDIANALCIATVNVVEIERGNRTLSLPEAYAVRAFLGCGFDELTQGLPDHLPGGYEQVRDEDGEPVAINLRTGARKRVSVDN
jgi:transcriptional regulator with XRE-family HTH domain